MTREQILEIDRYCQEHGISLQSYFDEHGIARHQYFIWKRKLPHPGDGPKHQKKGSDGKIEDVRWNEKRETTKRIYGEAPAAIVYDINKIFDNK